MNYSFVVQRLQLLTSTQIDSSTSTSKTGSTPASPGDAINSPTFVCIFVLFSLAVLSGSRKKRKVKCLIPCTTCRFFSNNTYLKCAVQPTLVLTEQAKNCPDYLFVYPYRIQQEDEKI